MLTVYFVRMTSTLQLGWFAFWEWLNMLTDLESKHFLVLLQIQPLNQVLSCKENELHPRGL